MFVEGGVWGSQIKAHPQMRQRKSYMFAVRCGLSRPNIWSLQCRQNMYRIPHYPSCMQSASMYIAKHAVLLTNAVVLVDPSDELSEALYAATAVAQQLRGLGNTDKDRKVRAQEASRMKVTLEASGVFKEPLPDSAYILSSREPTINSKPRAAWHFNDDQASYVGRVYPDNTHNSFQQHEGPEAFRFDYENIEGFLWAECDMRARQVGPVTVHIQCVFGYV